MNSSFVRRAAALAAGGALLVSGLAATGPAQAAPGDDPAAEAASWLTTQLTDGLIQGPWGPDYGLSIDFALSLAEVGGHSSEVEAVADAVAASVDQYIAYDFPPYEEGDPHYSGQVAGATAKALRLAQAVGEGPEFGGVDLVERLETLVLTDGPVGGRIADEAFRNGEPDPDGDYANVIGQAYAASTLTAEGTATRGQDVVDFLLQQQCSDGFFRLYFNQDKEAADQSCDGGTPAESAPDTDVTALVAVLLADQAADEAIGAALDDARSWLLDSQLADGSFGGGPTTAAPNSNSTGLAGWALGTLGEDAAAAHAAAWVRAHQVQPIGSCATALDSEAGAIAYDQAALAAGHQSGITAGVQDQWRRAGAQAAPALAWAPAFTTGDLALTDPRTFHRAGSTATFTVSGLSTGEAVCLSGAGLTGVGASVGG
ncbi:hypothetical protein, partial [Nocardioides sp.]|uniref:hypothetical protein n=1 Tax=Nocardioides sp. TaxID=35761 RepID=UPI0027327838